jgi:hypothetical protein
MKLRASWQHGGDGIREPIRRRAPEQANVLETPNGWDETLPAYCFFVNDVVDLPAILDWISRPQ